jgi:rubrerythrin
MSFFIPPPKKLSQDDSYSRPEKTITETVQNIKDIEAQLENFEEISEEDLNFINVNTQLKYLSYDKKNKKELFRFGGLLVKVAKEYVILAGKEGLRFSAQRYTRNEKDEIIHKTRFFKKIKETELLKNKLIDTYEESKEIIQKQNEIIEKQKKELLAMKKKLKK